MKSAITMILLLIAGQAIAAEQVISVQHDSARGVTCWILNNTGISCLPDSSLPQKTDQSDEASRAYQASSVSADQQLEDISLPQTAGLQL